MGKNVLYSNEIATAGVFVKEHEFDKDLMMFLNGMKNDDLSHSDRWSLIYDYLDRFYPNAPASIVTGLTYWVEK